MKERARRVPVVRRFFWPPEMPRISSLPTRISAHMSSPRICTHQRRQWHHNRGHRQIGPIFAREARNAMCAPVLSVWQASEHLAFLAYSPPSRRSSDKEVSRLLPWKGLGETEGGFSLSGRTKGSCKAQVCGPKRAFGPAWFPPYIFFFFPFPISFEIVFVAK